MITLAIPSRSFEVERGVAFDDSLMVRYGNSSDIFILNHGGGGEVTCELVKVAEITFGDCLTFFEACGF